MRTVSSMTKSRKIACVLTKKVDCIAPYSSCNGLRLEDTESDDGDEWQPEKHGHDTDMDSSDDSDVELVKQEANEFIRGSTADRHGSVTTKKPCDDAHDDQSSCDHVSNSIVETE